MFVVFFSRQCSFLYSPIFFSIPVKCIRRHLPTIKPGARLCSPSIWICMFHRPAHRLFLLNIIVTVVVVAVVIVIIILWSVYLSIGGGRRFDDDHCKHFTNKSKETSKHVEKFMRDNACAIHIAYTCIVNMYQWRSHDKRINCIKPSENCYYNILLNCNLRLISAKPGQLMRNTQCKHSMVMMGLCCVSRSSFHLLRLFCLFVCLFDCSTFIVFMYFIRARCLSECFSQLVWCL